MSKRFIAIIFDQFLSNGIVRYPRRELSICPSSSQLNHLRSVYEFGGVVFRSELFSNSVLNEVVPQKGAAELKNVIDEPASGLNTVNISFSLKVGGCVVGNLGWENVKNWLVLETLSSDYAIIILWQN